MQFDQLKRREFIAIISGGVAWPLAVRAQQPGKLRTIGFSGQSTRSAESELVAAFTQRLHELGWIEGRTITIEYRWSEGRAERFVQIAAEFVRLKVDLIVTSGTPQVLAAKQATLCLRGRETPWPTALSPVWPGRAAGLSSQGDELAG